MSYIIHCESPHKDRTTMVGVCLLVSLILYFHNSTMLGPHPDTISHLVVNFQVFSGEYHLFYPVATLFIMLLTLVTVEMLKMFPWKP